MKMISGQDIPVVEKAGVLLGAAGPVTSVQYKMDTSHISFYEVGWQEFLKRKRRLRVDKLVLMTIRNNSNNKLHMIVGVDLI